MAPTDPALAPNLSVDITVAELTVTVNYAGQPVTGFAEQGGFGLGQCYNSMLGLAVPAGTTRFDSPVQIGHCLFNSSTFAFTLTPGDYSIELRPHQYSEQPVGLTQTLSLAAGPNSTTVDLAATSGLVMGPLTINGKALGTAYRVCYDVPLVNRSGASTGSSQYCAYGNTTTTLKLLAPAGTTTASIFNISNGTKIGTIEFDAVQAGQTTSIEPTNFSVADLAVTFTYDGQPLSGLQLSSCYHGATAFAIPAGATRASNPPRINGCLQHPFPTISGLAAGDYSFEVRPNYWSAAAFTQPVSLTLEEGTNPVTVDLASGSGLLVGAVSLNGTPAGTDYRVCFDDALTNAQGQPAGVTAFCAYLKSDGTFAMFAPAGTTSGYVAHASSAAKTALLSFPAVTPGVKTDLGTTDIVASDLTVNLTYGGEPVVQIGACWNSVIAFAIPEGKTRNDSPPVAGACLNTNPSSTAPLVKLGGLTPGNYTAEVRPEWWSAAPLGSTAVTVAPGSNSVTIDLATSSGLLTGTLTINGQPASADYRVCYDFPRVGPTGQNFGTATYCARVNNGGFKLYAPAGSLKASIISSSNITLASIATAIAAGQTTTLGSIAVGTPGATLVGTNVEVHPDVNGTADYQATVIFPLVTADGITSMVRSAQGPALPAGYVSGNAPLFYTIATTAAVSGTNTVCFDYTGTTFMRPANLLLMQRNAQNTAWSSITYSRDIATRTICGRTSTLGMFTIIEPANRAPVISSATGSANGEPGSSSLSVVEGTLVSFTGAASDADSDALTYTWSFSDGAPTQSGASIQRTFGDNSSGAVTVTLTVADPFGGTATQTVSVTANNIAPTATFTSSTNSLKEGESFTLALSSPVDVPADLATLRFAFDCGMGEGYSTPGTTAYLSCVASAAGTRTVKGMVSDKDGGTTEYTEIVTVIAANAAPTADAGSNSADGTYSGSEGVSIAFNGSNSTDPDGDQLAYEWNFDGALGQDGLLHTQSTSATPSFTYLDDGVYTATLTVRDGKGGSDTKTVQVTVANTNPSANFVASPMSLLSGGSFTLHLGNATDAGAADRAAGFTYAFHCGDGPAPGSFTFGSAASATCPTTASRTGSTRTALGVVRDKDGGMRQYDLSVTVAGNLPPTLNVAPSYSADEGEAISLGWMASDPEGHALTYAWDFGNGVTGSGSSLPTSVTYADNPTGASSYSISVTVSDELGSVTRTASATIANVAPTLGAVSGLAAEPAAVGSAAATMSIGASFTDVGIVDTHTGSVACGNGTSVPATISAGRAVGTCTYAAAGVYRASVTVTDDDGGTATRGADGYVVIYDPTAGFVTGGGWMNYDAQSCTVCGEQAGRGEFGFVSKYQKGTTVPSGETRFEFHAGALRFASTEYEWLVVSNNRAQFRGTGRINGQGDYAFTLTAVDGSPDTFRIQIWERSKTEGEYVFDNRRDTALDKVSGGGSITIHSK